VIDILPGDFSDQRVTGLIIHHFTTARAATDICSAHALDIAGLQTLDITLWTAWNEDTLMGVGALKQLTTAHGEVKSMHVLEAMRGRGAGSAILRHIIDAARARGYARLSLETGSMEYFAPARALYRRHGFADCEPFGEYVPDRNSCFLTIEL